MSEEELSEVDLAELEREAKDAEWSLAYYPTFQVLRLIAGVREAWKDRDEAIGRAERAEAVVRQAQVERWEA